MKNTFVKVLSFMMALMMVVGTFGTLAVFAAEEVECDHSKGTYIDSKPATCLDGGIGYSRWICGKCGEEWITDVVLPGEEHHKYTIHDAVAASCLTNAMPKAEICDYCGKDKNGLPRPEEEGTRKDHLFARSTIKATCINGSKTINTCVLCKYTAEQLKDMEDFDGFVDPASHPNFAGYKTYNQVKAVEADNALDPTHALIEVKVVTSPTTCEDGKAVGKCSICGFTKEITIPAEHDFEAIANIPCDEWQDGAKRCKLCSVVDGVREENPTDHVAIDVIDEVTEFNPASLPDGFTMAEIRNAGFADGDDLYKANSCTEAGFQLAKCSCGEVYKKDLDAKTHTWERNKNQAYSASVKYNGVDCTKPVAYKDRACGDCGAIDYYVIVAAPATAHTNTVKTQEPDCTNAGYDYTVCDNTWTYTEGGIQKNGACTVCDNVAADRTNYVDNLGGHKYEKIYASGKCGGTGEDALKYREICKVCEDGKDSTPKAAAADEFTAHTYGDKYNVAATCVLGAHEAQTCSYCGYVLHHDVPADSEPDETAHVYIPMDADSSTDGVQYKFVGEAPECVASADVYYVCEHHDNEIVVRKHDFGDALHNYVHGYKEEWEGGTIVLYSTGADGKYIGRAGTCEYAGDKGDGIICTICETYKVEPTSTEKDANVHEYNGQDQLVDANKLGDATPATCQHGTIQRYNTKCCGMVEVEANDKVPHTDAVFTLEVPAEAATCFKAGVHKHVACKYGCGTVKAGSIETTGCTQCSDVHHTTLTTDASIPMLEHDFELDESTKVYETCVEFGLDAYEVCEHCDIARYKGTIYNIIDTDATKKAAAEKALDNARYIKSHGLGQTFTNATAIPATCAAYGEAAGTFCRICDGADRRDTTTYPDWIDGQPRWKTVKVSHKLNTYFDNCKMVAGAGGTQVPTYIDCTKAYAYAIVCYVCGHEEEAKYFDAAHDEHDWDDPEVKSLDSSRGEYSCNTDVTQTRTCKVCNIESEPELVTEATGCYTTQGTNGVKLYFDFACNEISKFAEYKCDICGKSVQTIINNDMGRTDGAIKHTIVETSKESNCAEAGYVIEYCTKCTYVHTTEDITYVKPDGHTSKALLEYVPAQVGVDGYELHECSVCDEQYKIVIPAIEFSSDVEATISVSKDMVTAGVEEFDVEIALSADSLEFSELEIALNIPGFVAYSDKGIYTDAAGSAVEVIVSDNKIVLYPSSTADTMVLDEATITITLLASDFIFGECEINVVTDAKAYVYGEEIEELAVKIFSAADTVNVGTLGNVNGDIRNAKSEINTADLKLLVAGVQDAMINGTKEQKYDINRDGSVDTDDVMALRKFAASSKTVYDYAVMVNVDVAAVAAAYEISLASLKSELGAAYNTRTVSIEEAVIAAAEAVVAARI